MPGSFVRGHVAHRGGYLIDLEGLLQVVGINLLFCAQEVDSGRAAAPLHMFLPREGLGHSEKRGVVGMKGLKGL